MTEPTDTIERELTGPDIAQAIGDYVLKHHPGATGGSIQGPLHVMMTLGQHDTGVTVTVTMPFRPEVVE